MNQPYLVAKENFHPKRNQARQKLATLPPGRFKELAADVLYEIERRYPVVVESASSGQYPSSEDGLQRTVSVSSMGSQRSQRFSQQSRNENLSSTSRDRFPNNNSSNNLATTTIPEEPETEAIPRTGVQNTIIPNKSTMVEEDGPDDDAEDTPLIRSASKLAPIQKSFLSNTIVPNTSIMVEESGDELENEDETVRVNSTRAPSIAASMKSLSPPIFKSSTFANANNANARKTRSISPPLVLPKSRAQVEEEERKEQEMQEKMVQYEDKIEALKERITELQDDLRKAKEELQMERAKSPPPLPPSNDDLIKELEVENNRLKEELRTQQEVFPWLKDWLTVRLQVMFAAKLLNCSKK